MTTALFLQDVTLRDGMHAVRHRITPADVGRIVAALDAAGVDAIEVAHGDGLAGGSLNYGPGSHTDWEWIEAAAQNIHPRAVDDRCCPASAPSPSSSAPTAGVCGRCASRPTAPRPTSPPSTSHRPRTRHGRLRVPDDEPHAPPPSSPQQAKLMESYGAHCVYVTDSGGRLTMDGVRERVRAYRDVARPGHRDRHPRPREPLAGGGQLGRGRRGGRRPGSTRRSPDTAPAPATARSSRSSPSPTSGLEARRDLFALQDAADDIVRPLQDRPVRVDRETLTLGYAGVYSSFLRHAETAAARYGLDVRERSCSRSAAGGWSAARRT